MTDNVPATLGDLGGGGLTVEEQKALKDASSSYLGYLAIVAGSSNLVMKGMPVGNWALVRGEAPVDLGKSIDAAVLAMRFFARNNDTGVMSFDRTSNTYKDIALEAQAKGSNSMCGPQFLLFIPSLGEFVTLGLMSWSAKKISDSLGDILATTQFARFGVAPQQNKDKQTYFVPTVTKQDGKDVRLPSKEECLEQINKFKTAKAEAAPEKATETKSRER